MSKKNSTLILKELKNPKELEEGFSVLTGLRPDLNFAQFCSIYQEAKTRDQFTIMGGFEGARCVAIMCYRVLFDFVHGKHIYIDDLVVDESRRSQGIGAQLLAYAEQSARKLECEGLRLCTGLGNKGAQEFYERNGWAAKSVAFKKHLIRSET